ncbi:MAG: TRAP transporter substrate-binding protein [Rhodobacteraceae bacterium]|nr:TRAP transporter substrate-binding protein [Paracoccaceae bacterium]
MISGWKAATAATVALATASLGALSTGQAQADATTLRFAIFTPDREQTFQTVMKPFAEAVNEALPGTVRIELYPNGALGRNPVQQAQMVLDGVADIAWTIASYTPGRFHENEVFELPGLFADMSEGTLVFTRLVMDGKIAGYEDFVPIGTFTTAPYSVHTNGTVRRLDDLDGRTIRSASAIEGETLQRFGAVPIGMPVTEVAEAISRRTIDGTTLHPSPLFDFGVERVTSTHYFMPLGLVPLAILMNRKRFEALPAEAQEAILAHSGMWTAERFNEHIGIYNESLVEKLVTDPRHEVLYPSDAELARMQVVYDEVIAEWAAKSPRNAELLEIVRAEIAAVRAGN